LQPSSGTAAETATQEKGEIMSLLQKRTIEMLDRLVAFDSTSRNSNLELIEFIRTYLLKLGARIQLIYSEDRHKANLLATIGPNATGGIMLSAHSDVVPVDGQDWRSDPFHLEERNGNLYGRGAADMKGFLATVLAAVPAFAKASLSEPLHIAVSYDEEAGLLGVQSLIKAMREIPVKPRMCIVGEPTEMKVAIGHKGRRAYIAHFRGKAAHSSLCPMAVNAVEHAADLVTRLRALGELYEAEGPFDNDYDVPHTTVHTGMIHGGVQVNIVPAFCDVEFEYRHLPEVNPDEIETKLQCWLHDEIEPPMKALDSQCGVELELTSAYPGLSTGPQEEVVRLCQQLADGGAPIKIAFGTEAGSFQQGLGTPSVVCGPGSIRQAHQPDEFISLEMLAACEQFIERLRRQLL
jgi:acetylornithine deacetylase